MNAGLLSLLIVLGIVGAAAIVIWLTERIPDWSWALRMERERRTDEAAVIYAKIVEMLTASPEQWERHKYGGWEHKSAGIQISSGGYTVAVGKTSLAPSTGWQMEISRAVSAIEAAERKAKQLNAICDAVETLGASNVIPMRRGGNNV